MSERRKQEVELYDLQSEYAEALEEAYFYFGFWSTRNGTRPDADGESKFLLAWHSPQEAMRSLTTMVVQAETEEKRLEIIALAQQVLGEKCTNLILEEANLLRSALVSEH